MLSGNAATIGHISCTACINAIYCANTCGIHFDQQRIIKSYLIDLVCCTMGCSLKLEAGRENDMQCAVCF